MALIDAYTWRSCDGAGSISVDTGSTTPTDYVIYNGGCYFNTFVVVQVASTIDISNETFFQSCSDCISSTGLTSVACSLFGQVNIELSGNIELVLEGELDAVKLKGQQNFKMDGMEDIYLEGILNDPLMEANLELIVELEGCIVEGIPPTPTPTVTDTPKPSNSSLVTSTPTPTPTITPSTTPPCTNCTQYLVVNDHKSNSLTVSYTNCNNGSTEILTVGTEDSKPVCSCTFPAIVTPSGDSTITPQGACGLTPTPTKTPTNTPTPSKTPASTPTPTTSQTTCVAQVLDWSFDNTDACNGTNLSTTTYYGPLPLSAGDVLYSNSGCSTPASTGRYIVLGGGTVLYVNSGGVLSNYTC